MSKKVNLGTSKKRGRKSDKNTRSFPEDCKNLLAESDKGSWYDRPASTSKDAVNLEPSASRKKLLDEFETSSDSGTSSESDSYENEFVDDFCDIVNRSALNQRLAEHSVCSHCKEGTVIFLQESRTGLGNRWFMKCQNNDCGFTSLSFDTTSKQERIYDVNRSLVLGLRMIGRGFSAAKKLLSILNLPLPVSRGPWGNHTKALNEIVTKLLEEDLRQAGLEVRQYQLNISEEFEENGVVNAGVSVDGSWSSRGWTARDGLVSVISIDTGKVLDVVYLTNNCSQCVQKERQVKEGEITHMEYCRWCIQHEETCMLNHEGSSQTMESEGVARIFGRSLEKHNIRYSPFVGDGDSKSYSEVLRLAPYGPAFHIPKEDCIAHVTKRMGTALRKLTTEYKGKKLEDGLGLGGRGRLTIARIDTFQNFYGKAIRDNKGDAAKMSQATHAILKHYSSTPETPRHEDCPTGPDSWCTYNNEKATHVPIENPVPPAVVDVVLPVFDRLGKKEFLVGCEKCLTQNANESLHHVIWGLAPKEQYTSHQETNLAVALGVMIFNSGAQATLTKLMSKLNIPVTDSMLTAWSKIDKQRIYYSDYKTKLETKQRRKKRKREKTKKQDAFVHQEGVHYKSQQFYTST